MIWFFVFLIIPIAWIIFAKVKFHTFTWKEAGIQFGISIAMCFILAIGTLSSRYTGTMDVEILNGYVTNKYSQRVSCTHSYQCNCRTDSDGNRTCQTCYEHPYDMDWIVDTTVGSLKISRVNRQGTREPPRFSKVEIGEPASLENRYTNYIKAVPESIFNVSEFSENSNHAFPNYPRVRDYYRVRHVLNSGADISRAILDQWDSDVKDALKTLGHTKQVNIVIVTTNNTREYARDLEYAWLRGKKNDVVVVMGIDNNAVDWVHSFGWSTSSRVFHEIEDGLTGKSVDDSIVYVITDKVSTYYDRQSFSQYAYLIDEVSPPVWAVILMFIINMVITGVIGYKFVNTGGSYRPKRLRFR